MGVKPAGGVNREAWMADVEAYARGNGHVSSPLHQTRLCYSLIPEEPAMVDAAKHTHTSGMDDAFVAALAPKAHKRLGTDAGNALMFSLHTARRVESRVSASKLPDAALREIEAALRSWSRDFGAAVCSLAEGTPNAVERTAKQADRAADYAKVASAAGHRAGIYKTDPGPVIHVEVTEEDMLLANAGLQDYVDMLYEIEYGNRYDAPDD